MSFRKNIFLLVIWIVSLYWGCVYPKPDWENVNSDHEPVLNVFGLISLDEKVKSFVDVRRTLSLDEKQTQSQGVDFESKFLVKEAVVEISDGINTYTFNFIPYKPQDKQPGGVYLDKYYDTTRTFIPQPNTLYTLKVTTEKWGRLTGEVVTPNFPEIVSESVPDTVYTKIPYTVKYRLNGDSFGKITTDVVRGYFCGAEHQDIIYPGSSEWTTPPVNCSSDWSRPGGVTDSDTLEITLRTMDAQYYEYIIKESASEFVDLLTGSGGTAKSIGVEGGYGVFGAITADRIFRVIIP